MYVLRRQCCAEVARATAERHRLAARMAAEAARYWESLLGTVLPLYSPWRVRPVPRTVVAGRAGRPAPPPVPHDPPPLAAQLPRLSFNPS